MVVGQVLWLKKSVSRLRVVDNNSRPLTIYFDNKSTIFFSSNNKSSDATKHIDIKYFVVKDRKGLPPIIFCDHLADMVHWKASNSGISGPLMQPSPVKNNIFHFKMKIAHYKGWSPNGT
jgi:hypothetical protein